MKTVARRLAERRGDCLDPLEVKRIMEKLTGACPVKSAEANLMLAIIEQAFLDANGLSSDEHYKQDSRKESRDASRFLRSQRFYHYVGLLGIDEDYARFVIQNKGCRRVA
jgi:hypothetical protein